jgi:CelD/BcsL family acetyltransferase involved in cellulose biosynthesis
MNLQDLSTPAANCAPEPIKTFKLRVADTVAHFADVWPRTDRFGSARCYAFQCADMLQVWCDSLGKARGTRPLFIGVFDEIDRPVLLLPLGIEREGGIQVLRFLDGGVCDYNAPVMFEPLRRWDRETIQRLWRAVVRALPRFDLAIFDKMPADICGTSNPLTGLGVTPYERSGHFINLTSTWDEYAAKRLPYKRESAVQRRRLARIGRVAFTVAKSSVDRERILGAMLRQKSRRYLETWGVDGLDRPGYRQYYNAIVEQLSWPGPLVITALEIDDKVLATNWGFLADKRFIGIVMTFEGGEFKRLSPGRVLLEEFLKWHFENGTRVFDFGIGDERYKVAYTDQRLLLYQATTSATFAGAIRKFARNSRTWQHIKRAINR